MSVDPLAELATDWTPYRYGFNNPIIYIDPDGQFESRKEARQWARDNGIKIGFFRNSHIKKVNDGSFAIENYFEGTSTSNLGGELGVVTAGMYSNKDIVEWGESDEKYTSNVTYRDGSEGEFKYVQILEIPDLGGKKGTAKGMLKNFKLNKTIKKKYKRPSGATTKKQREAVQGKPCVTCGKVGGKRYADHIEPLVLEYYKTGKIDKKKMRSIKAVQSQCATCSHQQGGILSGVSRRIKKILGL